MMDLPTNLTEWKEVEAELNEKGRVCFAPSGIQRTWDLLALRYSYGKWRPARKDERLYTVVWTELEDRGREICYDAGGRTTKWRGWGEPILRRGRPEIKEQAETFLYHIVEFTTPWEGYIEIVPADEDIPLNLFTYQFLDQLKKQQQNENIS